jgi:predicted nucleic acid-binding protein
LDTGALIALERGDPRVRALLRAGTTRGATVHVPAPVVAQAWRDGSRQVTLARFLHAAGVTIPAMDEVVARAVGRLCGSSGHHDVVDAHVALDAHTHRHLVVTSDPDDIAAVVPTLHIVAV